MFEDRDFETILSEMLAAAGDDIDTSVGSIFYDAAAPAAMELSGLYSSLRALADEIFPDTSSEEYLLLHAAEAGITRGEATCSVIIGGFDTEIPSGTQFILDKYTYLSGEDAEYTGDEADETYYYYELTCETAGASTAGNTVGTLVPTSYIDGLTYAEALGLIEPGEDAESVASLRSRVISALRFPAFSGNVAEYRNYIDAFDGVGGTRIYPAYDGGGTVKAVVMSSEGGTPSDELISTIKESLDPTEYTGEGMGISPIGHSVSVVGADEYSVLVRAVMTFADGWTLETSRSYLEDTVSSYIKTLADSWEDVSDVTIRISKIESCLYDTGVLSDIQSTAIYDAASGEYVTDNIVLSGDEVPVFGGIEEA